MDHVSIHKKEALRLFRKSSSGHATEFAPPGFTSGMLSNPLNKERFEMDSLIKLSIKGEAISYTLGITFQPGDISDSTVMVRRMAALAHSEGGEFKDDGIVFETVPHYMEPSEATNRNFGYLMNHGGIPEHIMGCFRLLAGVFNYLLDCGIGSRDVIKDDEYFNIFVLGLSETKGLVRRIHAEPVGFHFVEPMSSCAVHEDDQPVSRQAEYELRLARLNSAIALFELSLDNSFPATSVLLDGDYRVAGKDCRRVIFSFESHDPGDIGRVSSSLIRSIPPGTDYVIQVLGFNMMLNFIIWYTDPDVLHQISDVFHEFSTHVGDAG